MIEFLNTGWKVDAVNHRQVVSSGVHGIRRRVDELDQLTDQQLHEVACDHRSKIVASRATLKKHEILECISLLTSAVSRVYGFQLHDVQCWAIRQAAQGMSLQMQTGEGKSIVAIAVAYVYSHLGSVHLATTNPYLAQRDYETSKPLLDLLGCTSGLIRHDQDRTSKRDAYRHQITIGPGYQFGFDYLADQAALREANLDCLGVETLFAIRGFELDDLVVQPCKLATIIVDEADSVLIDESMSPLILSGGVDEVADQGAFHLARRVAGELVEGEDYQVDPEENMVKLFAHTVEKACSDLAFRTRQLQLVRPWQKYLENALVASRRLKRGEHYVVVDEQVKIVDQSTGRIFDDRQWQAGLHQAVEAKEGVAINGERRVLAQITRQCYFHKYAKLIGLSGTLTELSRELRSVYGIQIARIPTHRNCCRRMLRTRYFATRNAKINAIVGEVSEYCSRGQPVLIGTRTIEQSLWVKAALDEAKVKSSLLNGVQDENEATIVSRAGQAGTVTIATNMAGRGTDIKLSPDARKAGGLYAIGFEHNFSRRVDRQLIGRCARQGDPGSFRFFVSAEDDLIVQHDPALGRRMQRNAGTNGEIHGDFSKPIKRIQLRHEKRAQEQRRQIVEHGNWQNKVRKLLSDERV